MKLIAHRGWSAGGDENTLAAFARAASDERIAGVEFDVCRAVDAMTLVVSHDPPLHGENPLTLDAALSFLSRTNLELCVEIKQGGLAPMVIEKLVSGNVADRSVVFAFAGIARSFPWEGARPVRLGVIVMCPWNLLVVLVLARAARSGLQTAGRGGHCATLGRPSLALATAHPRGGCRYRSDPSGRRRVAASDLIKSAPMSADHDLPRL